MAKNKPKQRRIRITHDDKVLQRIYKALGGMTYKDLQAACIIRGLKFSRLPHGDHSRLTSWLIKNWNNPVDKTLLFAYEDWVDEKLSKKYPPDHPIRKFRKWTSSMEVDNLTGKKQKRRRVKTSAVKGIPKPKKVKDTHGIYSGTKKSYTFELVDELWNSFNKKYDSNTIKKKFFDQLYQKVCKKFPDAKESSVRSWASRCLKSHERLAASSR